MPTSVEPAPTFFDHVYAVARRIPRGRVTTYGAIAAMLGQPRAARAVGYALNALNDRIGDDAVADVPWPRVINAQGRISIVNREFDAAEQAARLRAEGVEVDDELRVDLDRYAWDGLDWSEVAALIGRN
ncbi:MAG: MGMT family protein [Ardenticatenales bacterium]